MTTNAAFLQAEKDFDAANAALKADAKQVQDDIATSDADYQDYLKKLSGPGMKDSMYALVLLFYIMGASTQNSTAMGYFTDKAGVTGDRLKLNGDLTKAANALNQMTQSGSSGPDDMHQFAKRSDLLLDELYGNGPGGKRPGFDPNLDPTVAKDPSMDPSTETMVFDQILGIRQEFKLGGADPESGTYDPAAGATYYFDPTDATKIQTFAEFQTDLGLQGDKDKGATAAAKLMSDNFATSTQSTQTASAVLNNDQKTYMSMEQTLQSFIAAIAQLNNAQAKNSISHMTTG